MPQHKSAIKRVRQNAKRREANRKKRSTLRTYFKKAMQAEDVATAEPLHREAVSHIDRAAVKNLINKKKAARLKAQLANRLNSLS